jgi:hypothetical protein
MLEGPSRKAMLGQDVRNGFDRVSVKLAGVVERVVAFSGLGPKSRAGLRQVHGEPLQIGERAIGQSSLMSGTQDHARCLACLKRFLPALGA